jgi:hypothetical protein
MTADWKLIWTGFAIAGTGAAATMLYIVGASAAYVGRFATSGLALVAACVLALTFRRYLGRYLDALAARAGGSGDDDSSAVGGDQEVVVADDEPAVR